MAQQVAAAQQLIDQLAASNQELADLVSAYNANGKKANTLLEQLDKATKAADEAHAEAAAQQKLLDLLRAQIAQSRADLRTWAFHAYADGGSVAELAGVLDALSADPSTMSDSIGDLTFVTGQRALRFENLQTLSTRHEDALAQAKAANVRAARAKATAAAAKAELDATMKSQVAQLDALRADQNGTLAAAGQTLGVLTGTGSPEAAAAYRRLMAELSKNGASATATGATCSNDEAPYPNGQIPASGLCPLWQAPGEMLRPRAAAAFNAMSQAYAKSTGRPLCVTDSYRSVGEQYAVKASRGMWAAAPGTSPHGLGIALDLCGGVGTFYSPAYLWMLNNGPAYGWYHPSWADPGGSLPEPWHWQFAG